MKKKSLLKIAVHLYAWSALAHLLFDALTGNISPNPIQELEQRTGRHAVTLLVLSLACTPLTTLLHWNDLLKQRRALGLYALMYASVHALIFVNLDYGLAWSLLAQTVFEKPYILVGTLALLALIPLGVTSFDIWKKRLKKKWKWIHRMVYLIAPLAILHYAWSKKGALLALQGDVLRPAIYGLILGLLLLLRLPPIRSRAAALLRR